MNIFKKNISGLEAEAKQLTETNEQLTKDLAEAQALAAPNTEEIATLTNANTVLETKLAESEASLEASTIAQADFDGKVSSEVAKQIADSGLEAGKIDANNDEPELNALQQWQGMKDESEKAEFFKENKSTILAQYALTK